MPQLSMPENYWMDFKISSHDVEVLYNHLLEVETPQTTQELLHVLIMDRISVEKRTAEKKKLGSLDIYTPMRSYKIGDKFVLPAFDWKPAKVVATRKGQNPSMQSLEVIEVEIDGGEKRELAANLVDHKLNEPIRFNEDDSSANLELIIKEHGKRLIATLEEALTKNEDLVLIAGRWFPRSLLIDVNIGHLNLAEAMLEMVDGGPLPTSAIIDQIDLPSDANSKLIEFSLNLALQEDTRFDEVGPSGETLWFLHRLEPDGVRNTPVFLRWSQVPYPEQQVESLSHQFSSEICDEWEPEHDVDEDIQSFKLALIFPHWRAGTLPLSKHIVHLFPTAYEAPRVQFEFVDRDNQTHLSGWVVRPGKYVYGLRDWYDKNGLIPGSIIEISKSAEPGKVIISAERHKPTREWIRTGLIGSDGGIVFTEQKQNCTAKFNDRLAIFLSDTTALDRVWEGGSKNRTPLEKLVHELMVDLARIKPQGQVHAEELYAIVNLVRRCPPRLVLSILMESTWASHLGDLYFRLVDSGEDRE